MQPSSMGQLRHAFSTGNKITPLADSSVTPSNTSDDIFEQVRHSLDEAHKSIQLEMFKLSQLELAELLARKQREGVTVQVVLDRDLDTFEQGPECLVALAAAGVDVKFYPILGPTSHHPFKQIDHLKMLIVDGGTAIIGGMNWGRHSPANHDTDVKIEGPVVGDMQALFNSDYLKSGGQRPLAVESPPPHPGGASQVALLSGSEKEDEREIKTALLAAIHQASTSIHAELFYLTDASILKALVAARRRGVQVKILVDPGPRPRHPELPTRKALALQQLRDAGCEALWYVSNPETGSKLHAKLGIFDGREVIMGSANWTYSGFEWNREADVDILDEKVAGYYEDMFTSDFARGAQTLPWAPVASPSLEAGMGSICD